MKEILSISFTSFGGPEMHLALFQKKFVEERAYLTTKELLELNSLCQILPGPSSTQTLISIAFKMGGPSLAFISLLIWILPATVIMTLFAISINFINLEYFRFIGPMAVGFIIMAALKMSKTIPRNLLNYFLLFVGAIVSIIFHTPYAFPALLIFGAFMNVNYGTRDFIPNDKPLVNIKWANLTLMILILVFAALLGAITKSNFPKFSEPVLLFENTYRMGTMVFGGGNVLYSMILTEFVEFKQKQYLTLQEFTTGLGILQAIPGPTFTISTYVNGIAMKKLGYGINGQLLGCGIGTIAIFLPGTLLIFFVYPIWNQVKKYPIVYRSLDGIIAISVGLLWSAVYFMIKPYYNNKILFNWDGWLSLLIFALTIILLKHKKIPAIFLVICVILIGYLTA
ncbi:MAG: chromate transporter [Bacteroidota bacterium]|nr:chromate transporter [Bacteroidota bacterium]